MFTATARMAATVARAAAAGLMWDMAAAAVWFGWVGPMVGPLGGELT